MFGRRPQYDRQDHDAQGTYDGTQGWPPSPFAVLIRRDGSVLVDGEVLNVPGGEPVQSAVLDALQQHARVRGAAVEAEILDRADGAVTHVEVSPDGSSRVIRQEAHDGTHEPDPRPTAPDSPVGTPAAEPPSPEPVAAASPPSAGTGPAESAQPVAAATPPPGHVPDELAELVGLVTVSLDAGELERAAAVAFRLRQHSGRSFGAEHAYTVEARALEAYVAHRRGDFRSAAATCLELTRIRHRSGDPRTHEELTRAVTAWRQIDDVSYAIEQGRALLDVWAALAAQDGPTTRDTDLLHAVNRRLHALAAAAAARETGAA